CESSPPVENVTGASLELVIRNVKSTVGGCGSRAPPISPRAFLAASILSRKSFPDCSFAKTYDSLFTTIAAVSPCSFFSPAGAVAAGLGVGARNAGAGDAPSKMEVETRVNRRDRAKCIDNSEGEKGSPIWTCSEVRSSENYFTQKYSPRGITTSLAD